MSTAEREAGSGSAEAEREETRDAVRSRIVEAARDIVGEEGLDALSMRALGLRVGCSPATIYLHFHDKDELLRSVMEEGFRRLSETVAEERASGSGVAEAGQAAGGGDRMENLAATGRAYARFALENTGYFRAMFKMPRVAQMAGCPAPASLGVVEGGEGGRLLEVCGPGASGMERAALFGWGLMHGLTSLYLSGHLSEQVGSHEGFMELIESAIDAWRAGWKA